MAGFEPIVIALLVTFSAFLFAFSLIPVETKLSKRIKELEGLSVGEGETRLQLFERVFGQERRSTLVRELEEAGWDTTTPAQIGMRIAGGTILGALFSIAVFPLLHLQVVLAIACGVLVTFACGYAPIYFLHQAMENRRSTIARRLPDFLDMVATTVQAGLAMNAALNYAIEAVPGPLADELEKALTEIRLGRARAQALQSMAERVNVQSLRTTVTAINQAERLGANIAKVLSDLAEDVRAQRLLIIEEQAAQLPVRMSFPMAFVMLPSIFVVIFGTLVANFFAHQGQ